MPKGIMFGCPSWQNHSGNAILTGRKVAANGTAKTQYTMGKRGKLPCIES